MKFRVLSTALLAGLAFSQAAAAQDFDDRWYLTGSAGFNIQDNDRGTRNAPFGALGLGKFITPNWSIDGELNYQNPKADRNQDLNWSQYGLSIDARRHFMVDGRGWNPYVLMGLGFQRSEEEFDAFPSVNSPGQREDGNLAANPVAGRPPIVDGVLGGKMDIWTVGANWYLRSNFKLMLNYVMVDSKKYSSTARGFVNDDPNILEARAQFFW